MNAINCPLCTHRYKDPRSYKTHLKTHLVNKEFPEIIQKELLKLENREYRLYSCDDCQKTFTTIYSLRKHQKERCKANTCDRKKRELEKFLESTDDLQYLIELKKKIDQKVVNHSSTNGNTILTTSSTADGHQISTGGGHTFISDSNITINQVNQVNQVNQNVFVINNFDGRYNNHNGFLNDTILPHIENILSLIEQETDLQETLENTQTMISEYIDIRTNTRQKHKLEKQVVTVNEDINKVLENLLRDLYQIIHFNEDHPENHNVYITNLKTNICYYIYNNGWKRCGTLDNLKYHVDHIFEVLLESLADYIDNDEDDHNQGLLQSIRNKLKTNYNTEQQKIKKSLGRQYFDVAYNNRHIVEKTFEATCPKKTLNLTYKRLN